MSLLIINQSGQSPWSQQNIISGLSWPGPGLVVARVAACRRVRGALSLISNYILSPSLPLSPSFPPPTIRSPVSTWCNAWVALHHHHHHHCIVRRREALPDWACLSLWRIALMMITMTTVSVSSLYHRMCGSHRPPGRGLCTGETQPSPRKILPETNHRNCRPPPGYFWYARPCRGKHRSPTPQSPPSPTTCYRATVVQGDTVSILLISMRWWTMCETVTRGGEEY